jgi:hypothetical protein
MLIKISKHKPAIKTFSNVNFYPFIHFFSTTTTQPNLLFFYLIDLNLQSNKFAFIIFNIQTSQTMSIKLNNYQYPKFTLINNFAYFNKLTRIHTSDLMSTLNLYSPKNSPKFLSKKIVIKLCLTQLKRQYKKYVQVMKIYPLKRNNLVQVYNFCNLILDKLFFSHSAKFFFKINIFKLKYLINNFHNKLLSFDFYFYNYTMNHFA